MKTTFIIILLFVSHNAFSSRLDTIVLQLKWKHQFQFAGYYIAKEKGFYKDLQLEVKINEGTDFCNPVDSVINGDAQLGIGGTELLIQRNSGKPVIALLSVYQHSPLVLLCKKKADIRNIHNIIGKRVMIENQSTELYAYLKNEGIDPQTFINNPYQADLSLFTDDKVDFISAYITDEPYILRNRNIEYEVFSPQSAGIDFYNDILFTSEKFARNHNKKVDAFIEASKKGWIYALSNMEETAKIIYEKYSDKKEINHLLYEAKMSKMLIKNDIVEIGYMYNGRWQHIGETYVKLGMLKSDFNLANFVYSKDNYRSRLSLINYTFVGIVILAFIIGLIMISYYTVKYFDILRTSKTSDNEKAN